MREFADYVLDDFESSNIDYTDLTNEFSSGQKKNLIEYFALIEPSISISALYGKLNSELRLNIRNAIQDIITETYLIDYKEIIQLLKTDDFSIQKSVLKLCEHQKASYEFSDIEDIKNVIEILKIKFLKRGEETVKKGKFSSKEHQIWICECGKENPDNIEYCKKCHNDIYGFNQVDSKPKNVIDLLERKVEILNENLK